METSLRTDDRAALIEKLERSERRFRAVIENNADAIVVVGLDGEVRFANRAAEHIFGMDADELVGTPFGFPVVAGETTELDLTRRSGPPAVVEMRVVESEWEDAPARIASLRDITERKEAETAERRLIRERTARSAAEAAARRLRFLAESSTRLSSSLDHGAVLTALAELCAAHVADWVVVYVVDPDGQLGRLEVANRDPGRRELMTELRDQVIDPGGNHPALEVIRTGEPTLVPEVDEERLTAVAQGPRHLEILRELGVASFMIVPLIARGRAVGAISFISSRPERIFGQDDLELARDLALRAALAVDNARLYKEARDANRAKSDLLAVISHDLRTPLSSIIGYADLLRMGIPEQLGEGSLSHAERIRTGAQHLLYLIDELLTFARLDSGQAPLQLQDIVLQEVVYEVADVVRPLAEEAGLEFRLDMPDKPTLLRTDPGKLRQVLVNLSGNAVKFTERGQVGIEATPVDGHVMVRVRDSGVGIAPNDLDQIFQPFWQVEDGDHAHEGTGLGLSVVQRLTALLGGDIDVQSTLGEGSIFTVRLPRRPIDN